MNTSAGDGGAGAGASNLAAAKGVALGLALGVVGACGWALMTHFSPVLVGFVAWGVGWMAGKGVVRGNGGRVGTGWALTAVAITALCFALSKLLTILLRVSEGSVILDWWLAYQREYDVLDVLWFGLAVWPAWGIGLRGRDA